MPTRYLKPGIRDSERIESLSPDAEILYYRLLVSVDDFGRLDARPLIIKAMCFPIRPRAQAGSCAKWLDELVIAGLIITYVVDDKIYLQINRWVNKARSQTSKCPSPQEPHTPVDSPLTSVSATHTLLPGTGTGTGTGTENREPNIYVALARDVLAFLNEKTGRNYQPVKANLELIVGRLKDGATVVELRQVIAKKSREWQGDEKMMLYLRPATLFNRTKFAQYQGELLCLNAPTARSK